MIYIWLSACNTLSLRSRISYRNSTEQTKLAPDHLLTAPSFSLWTFQLIIYSQRRSWGLVDFITHYNASYRCFTDRVKASKTHLYDALRMQVATCIALAIFFRLAPDNRILFGSLWSCSLQARIDYKFLWNRSRSSSVEFDAIHIRD